MKSAAWSVVDLLAAPLRPRSGPSAISRTSKISAVECRLTGVGPLGVRLVVWGMPRSAFGNETCRRDTS